MELTLVRYTPDPEIAIAEAAAISHQDKPYDLESARKLVCKLIEWGHVTPLSFATFQFKVEDVSRVLSHQLVRHWSAQFVQQSARIERDPRLVVVPHTIEENIKAEEIFIRISNICAKAYNDLKKIGIPAEDARYILPNAQQTSLFVNMNGRTLRSFLTLRLDKHAQWEIRELANMIHDSVEEVAPTLLYNLKNEA